MDGRDRSFFVLIRLFDFAETIDNPHVEAEVVLDGPRRSMVYVRRVAAEEGSEVGGTYSKGQIGVEVVVEVSANGDGGLGEGLPDAELSGGQAFRSVIELAENGSAFARGGDGELFLGEEPVSYA